MKLSSIKLYHITHVNNLPGILESRGLFSDAKMVASPYANIGHNHIKKRRLTEHRVPCCGNRFVGEFVPFYYCYRSPMLYTINKGYTGYPAGCQKDIVHLVSTVGDAIQLNPIWAISDKNASAGYAQFYNTLEALKTLDWKAILNREWAGIATAKSAEFLVGDFFPWLGIRYIGCHNSQTAEQVQTLIAGQTHKPIIEVQPSWYYL